MQLLRSNWNWNFYFFVFRKQINRKYKTKPNQTKQSFYKMDLKGKNIIYMGGFGGIGQKCLEAFLKKQVKVSCRNTTTTNICV